MNTVGIALREIQLKEFDQYLVPRSKDTHKGNFGHILVIGGDLGYSGAVRLASEAALRVGAGLVSVAAHKENARMLNATRPEIMCHGIDTWHDLKPLIERATVVVVGPGLGKSGWAKDILKITLAAQKSLIVDADALNLLAEDPILNEEWILTPHPGEAGRLLETTAEAVQQDRVAAVIALQKKFGGVSVLKGAGTLICSKEEQPAICLAGNPGMATAGMGDVLSGVIAGLVGQGIPAAIAAQLGVCLHATAGDMAAIDGMRGLIASDLFMPLRKLVNPNVS